MITIIINSKIIIEICKVVSISLLLFFLANFSFDFVNSFEFVNSFNFVNSAD